MLIFGQLCLLGACVTSGFATCASWLSWHFNHRALGKWAVQTALACTLLLTLVMLVLAYALMTKDFRFDYVARYSSQLLPWHYSLSALWVGQAGSLLLWAWMLNLLVMAFWWLPSWSAKSLRLPAFGLLMAFTCFLVTTMVFAANPLAGVSVPIHEGQGLSPLLQHPTMLIHPPIVFLGYAAWAIPCALALAALVTRQLDGEWARQARPWALFAWATLGSGILLGAQWAYEELGWGGYWGWDPVENGSLIPWLTGTALLHALMTWRRRGLMKKTALGLAIVTFTMCNFATFLTRSGIFSSLHAFSQSSIGWLFLALMVLLSVAGGLLLYHRRADLTAENPISSLLSCEAIIWLSTIGLLLMAAVTCLGTVCAALSEALVGHKILVGPPFYNNVLMPIGLLILTATALAPLMRWGEAPSEQAKRVLVRAAVAGCLVACIAMGLATGSALGVGELFISILVTGIIAFALIVLASFLIMDARRRSPENLGLGLLRCLRERRGPYTGFLVHLGFFSLAIGITGSALGTQRQEIEMQEGQTIEWGERTIRLVAMVDRQLPDKLVAEAVLEVSAHGEDLFTITPAQHYHLLQNQWTTEVAIESDWQGDFYAILHGSAGEGSVRMTLIENPRMRWLWLGGGIMLLGSIISLWPKLRRRQGNSISRSPTLVNPEALRAIGLSKAFHGLPVLRRVEFHVAVGESVAIMGANGSGKTTLLRCLAGMTRWDEGQLWWYGGQVKSGCLPNRNDPSQQIGMIAHACQLYPNLTLLENLLFAARMTGCGQPRKQALEWLERVGLLSHADWLPRRISHGMRRRASIARGLIHQPGIIFMDEPFSGLDRKGRAWLAKLLTELQCQKKSICFTTHDRHQADQCAARVLVLRDGTLQAIDMAQNSANGHSQRLIA
jgi:cytochrome c-type biogenesis protein CcmF